jgi:hypothetical protein
MSAARRQLFSVHERVELPTTVLRTHDRTLIHTQVIERFPFVRWPSGQPCEPVNAYLLDSAPGLTGDTLKTCAAELSPLVRYCGSVSLGFEQLADGHIFAFAQALQSERSRNHPTQRVRDNNTVRNLLRRAIAFLQWYQAHLMLPTQTPLIGESEAAPRIIVRRLHSHRGGRQGTDYYIHRAMPTPSSRERKLPLPQSIFEDIERVIESSSDHEAQTERVRRRYAKHPERLSAQLEYVRARRRFMVWIMKRTGLRPAEMVEMPLLDIGSILQTQRLIIPTKKRRRRVAPLRSFPITLRDATIVQRYVIAREKYVRQMYGRNLAYEDPETLFLGVEGEAIRKTSLEKDFERLVKACGHTDVQACLSMFRHRFITYEVMVHLKEFMGSAGKSRQLMTDSDYRSILKRIAAKTGHGSPESLWHYIDLAWEEMDVWANVDRHLERVYATDSIHQELLDLRRTLRGNPELSAAELLDLAERLSAIANDVENRRPPKLELKNPI